MIDTKRLLGLNILELTLKGVGVAVVPASEPQRTKEMKFLQVRLLK